VLQKLKPAIKCYIWNTKYMAAVVTTHCVTKEEEGFGRYAYKVTTMNNLHSIYPNSVLIKFGAKKLLNTGVASIPCLTYSTLLFETFFTTINI
jgi:hypothetical protein